MISRAALQARVREWGLTEEVVEKDYVLGWLLWGIGSHAALRDSWIFKGGTCLKKCFVETYRFSEDLDFTVLEGGPLRPDDLMPVLARLLTRSSKRRGSRSLAALRSCACDQTGSRPRAASTTAVRGALPARRA
jgi:predicted nucleotidyltransferase component of viral defense system